MSPEPTQLRLELGLDRPTLDALEQAVLRARATELAEVRRRGIRLTAGYGDATTRQVLDDEGDRAQRRFDALSRLLEAIREASAGRG